MHRYIALLGGINVGGHRVKMDTLRELFEALGFTNVATFIASGNIIFETSANDMQLLETQIEHPTAAAAVERLGIEKVMR